MNELKTFASHRPEVAALTDAERDDLWRRVTGDASLPPRRPDAEIEADLEAQPRGPMGRPRAVTIAAAALVVVAAGALAVGLGHRSATTPASPPPSPAPRLVQAFGTPPRLLLGDEWRLAYFNENADGVSGDFEFASTAPGADVDPGTTVVTAVDGSVLAAEVTQPAGVVQGMWAPGDRTDNWDPAIVGTSANGFPTEDAATTVAGHPARIFHAGDDRYVVVVATEGGSIELRVPATTRAELDGILADVRAAPTDEFDAALPDSVVTASQRAAAISDMLADVPLPTDVTTTALTDQAVYSDRTSLATYVAQLAVCGWLDQWFDTRDTDPARRDEALDALESSHGWAVLSDIDPARSGYPTALWETIDSLRTGGTVASGNGPIPITRANAAESLGCTW